jgi:hypothetical protein
MTPDWPGDNAPLPHARQEDRLGARLAAMVGAELCMGDCGRPVDRVLPDPIPDGYECMWSEAMCGRALYCRACFEAAS